MRNLKGRRLRLAAAGVVAVVVVAAATTGAMAVVRTVQHSLANNVKIDSCVNGHGGVTIERPVGPDQACAPNETPLSWSKNGGPEVWAAASRHHTPLTALGVKLGSVSLPAGSYVIQAKASVNDIGAGAGFDCLVYDTPDGLDNSDVKTAAAFDAATLTLQAVLTLAAPDSVSLNCSSTGGSTPSAFDWSLVVTKIGVLH